MRRTGRGQAWMAALGAVCAALAVALAAYASHGAEGQAQSHLQTAALFAFGHGVALATLAPASAGRLRGLALGMLLAGMLLFSGSLAAGVLLGWPTAAAPLGGGLMILGWLLLAAGFLRR